MKSAIFTKNFKKIPVAHNWESIETSNANTSFSFTEFTIPDSMRQNEVEPPSHVWDRIAKVLDEQDSMKLQASEADVLNVKGVKRTKKRRKIFVAAAVMVAGAIFFTVS